MPLRRGLLSALLLVALPHVAYADLCDGLKPKLAEDRSIHIDNKLAGAAQTSTHESITETYNEVTKDVLKDYPNADVLYIQERILFVFCGAIERSSLPENEKLDRIQQLWDQAYPPDSRAQPMPRCTPGQIVPQNADHVHIKLVAIRADEVYRSIANRRSPSLGNDLVAATKAGKIARMPGSNSAVVRINGLKTDQVPSPVPFLTGDQDTCQRMISMRRMPDGVVVISPPILGEQNQSVSTIVLPRRMFESSPDAQVCIEPSFRIVNHTSDRQNIYCDVVGVSGVAQAILRGRGQRVYFLVEGNPSRKQVSPVNTGPSSSGAVRTRPPQR